MLQVCRPSGELVVEFTPDQIRRMQEQGSLAKAVRLRVQALTGQSTLNSKLAYKGEVVTDTTKISLPACLDWVVQSWEEPSQEHLAIIARAARQDNAGILKELFATPYAPDILVNVQATRTALHVAAANGSIDCACFLIESAANVNAPEATARDGTPLHLAVQGGHRRVAQALIIAGADKDFPFACGDTPLTMAISKGLEDMALLLLQQGASKTKTGSWSMSPLLLAAKAGLLPVVRFLVEAGLDVDSEVDSPLLRALEHRNYNVAQFLLEVRSDPHRPHHILGCTPLQLACAHGHEGLVYDLLERRVDVKVADCKNRTALHRACDAGVLSIVTALLERGVELDHQDEQGETPLHGAVKKCDHEVVNALLSARASTNRVNNADITPLLSAAKCGDLSMVQVLVQARCDIEQAHGKKWTPLALAVSMSSFEAASFLLDSGVEPSSLDVDGRLLPTFFEWALSDGNSGVVGLLLEARASPNGVCKAGQTYLSSAVSSNDIELVQVLLSAKDMVVQLLESGADTNLLDGTGWGALHWAAHLGHTEMAQSLLDAQAAIDLKSLCGQTPLFAAIATQNLDAVHFLLQNGANKNTVDKQGSTPLHWAAMHGCGQIARLLVISGADTGSMLGILYTFWGMGFLIFSKKGSLFLPRVMWAKDKNRGDAEGWLPLDWACYSYDGDMELANALR